mmetsp:Transcript_38563/g.93419  ORF Transcript_38563/g.93419 Transcript_38563/m.93419 type:complete len:225 (-) Transcript_38563:83-757(-)
MKRNSTTYLKLINIMEYIPYRPPVMESLGLVLTMATVEAVAVMSLLLMILILRLVRSQREKNYMQEGMSAVLFRGCRRHYHTKDIICYHLHTTIRRTRHRHTMYLIMLLINILLLAGIDMLISTIPFHRRIMHHQRGIIILLRQLHINIILIISSFKLLLPVLHTTIMILTVVVMITTIAATHINNSSSISMSTTTTTTSMRNHHNQNRSTSPIDDDDDDRITW